MQTRLSAATWGLPTSQEALTQGELLQHAADALLLTLLCQAAVILHSNLTSTHILSPVPYGHLRSEPRLPLHNTRASPSGSLGFNRISDAIESVDQDGLQRRSETTVADWQVDCERLPGPEVSHDESYIVGTIL